MVPWLMNIMLTREEMASEVIGKAGYKSTLGEQIREAWLKNYDEWYCLRDSKISAIQVNRVCGGRPKSEVIFHPLVVL